MGWIKIEPFELYCPDFADAFVRCEAAKRLHTAGIVVCCDEVTEMGLELIVAVVVIALYGCLGRPLTVMSFRRFASRISECTENFFRSSVAHSLRKDIKWQEAGKFFWPMSRSVDAKETTPHNNYFPLGRFPLAYLLLTRTQ
jgi:hypothetical protein